MNTLTCRKLYHQEAFSFVASTCITKKSWFTYQQTRNGTVETRFPFQRSRETDLRAALILYFGIVAAFYAGSIKRRLPKRGKTPGPDKSRALFSG